MAGAISFSGLVSGLDTDKIINQLIALESRPISLLVNQKSKIQSQVDAFKSINTKLNALEDKAFELTQLSNIVARTATSADTNKLVATANADANIGSFNVDVLALASPTVFTSVNSVDDGTQGNGFGGVAAQSLALGDTVTNINTNNKVQGDITEGTFFVNGNQVTVTNGDTLATVFANINAATGGAVTATLTNDPGADPTRGGQRVTLTSGANITLTNGTSNILSRFNLDTSGPGVTRTSSDDINNVQTDVLLDGSGGATNLAQAVGSGTLTINGVGISINDTTDTLDDVIDKINNSSAGVTASFSQIQGGRLILTSNSNGPTSINVTDTSNFANAFGLGNNTDENLGSAAQISIDGGPTQFFNSNTGINPAGLTGITLDLLDADPGNPITVTVNSNSDPVVNKVNEFVNQFNSIVDEIDSLTSFNPETNEAGILISDFTVSSLKDRLKRLASSTVSGLSEGSSVGTLTELGITTGAIGSIVGTTNKLVVDDAKLRAAVDATPTRVAQIFGAEPTEDQSSGIFTRFKNTLDGLSNSTGIFAEKQKIGEERISDIDDRIVVLNDRLEKKESLLELQFTNLEKSLIELQTQQSALGGLIASIGSFGASSFLNN